MNLKKYLASLVLLAVLKAIACGQDQTVKVRKNDFRTTRESGLDEAWDHIRQGNRFYNEGPGTWRMAREHYLAACVYNSEYAPLNYRVGVCYLFTDQKHEAINFFRKAYIANSKVSRDIHLMLARSYHMILEFDKAIEHYTEFKSSLSARELNAVRGRIDKLIDECKNGKFLVEEPVRLVISNLGEKVNSAEDDYYAVLGPGDSVMYFTSRRPQGKKAKRSEKDNKYCEDVYYSIRSNGEWGEAVNIGKPVSDPNHNTAVVGISPDGQNLFLYRGDKQGGNLYVSRKKKGEWSAPKSMSRFNSRYRESGMNLSRDEETIYFISADEKESHGGKDIFVSQRNASGRWGKPVNIGRTVNTEYDEEGVFISGDGQTLYFSSKGHNTMGGYDVFKSEKDDLGEWKSPVNLGYPLNSPDDELFYSLDETGRNAHISAVRMGTVGGLDIFQVLFLGSEKEILMSTGDILVAGTHQMRKTGFFMIPEMMSIDTSYTLAGRVYDVHSGQGIRAKLDFIDVEQSRVVATTITSDSGTYRAVLSEGKAYGVEIVASDYLMFLDVVDLSSESPGEEIPADFPMEKVEVGATVVLENIFFESGKATLKPESYPQLDRVVSFMESNRSIALEISGHTDNTGSLKTNTNLSQGRAEAVVAYLVEQGIDQNRLEAKGYAFSQPIAPNDTPEGRAKNRRVEFKILSK